MVTGRVSGCQVVTCYVRRSTASECCLVLDLLWNAPTRLGVRGDYRVVADDFGNDDSLPEKVEDCRWVDGATSGVGQFCERVELYDLAIECLRNKISTIPEFQVHP